MTTLLTQKVGQDNERRCDAKCYDAKHPSCDCICGGRNHGCGEQQAMDNVREMFTEWADRVDPDMAQQLKQGILFARSAM